MPAAVGAVDVVEVEWTPTRRDVRRTVVAAIGRLMGLIVPCAVVGGGIVGFAGSGVAVDDLVTVTDDAYLESVCLLLVVAIVPLAVAMTLGIPHLIGAALWYLVPSARTWVTMRIDDVCIVPLSSGRGKEPWPVRWDEVRRVTEVDELLVLVARRGLRKVAVAVPLRVLTLAERTAVRGFVARNGLSID